MSPIILSPENKCFAFLKWPFWPSGCWDTNTSHGRKEKIPYFRLGDMTILVLCRSIKKWKFHLPKMPGDEISAPWWSKWPFQKRKPLIFWREDDWEHYQASQRPITASKTAFEVLENLPVLKNGHCLGKSWWIFDFLDNFPHYSSCPISFNSTVLPPEGVFIVF